MANINLMIDTSGFKPFTFQDKMAPGLLYKDFWNDVDSKYTEIERMLGTLEGAVQGSKRAKEMFDNYNEAFHSAADAFYGHRDKINTAKNLSEVRRLYYKDMTKLEQAREAMLKEIDRRKNNSDPTALYEDLGTLDNYLNPAYSPRTYSGALLSKQVSDAVSPIAKALVETSVTGKLDAYNKKVLTQAGIRPEEVNTLASQLMSGGIDAVTHPVFKNILNSVYKTSGIGSWSNAEEINPRAYGAMAEGLQSAIGPSTMTTIKDEAAVASLNDYYAQRAAARSLANQKELYQFQQDIAQKNALEKIQAQAAAKGGIKADGTLKEGTTVRVPKVDYLNLYQVQKDADVKNLVNGKYIKKYKSRDGAEQWEITKEGLQAYDRMKKTLKNTGVSLQSLVKLIDASASEREDYYQKHPEVKKAMQGLIGTSGSNKPVYVGTMAPAYANANSQSADPIYDLRSIITMSSAVDDIVRNAATGTDDKSLAIASKLGLKQRDISADSRLRAIARNNPNIVGRSTDIDINGKDVGKLLGAQLKLSAAPTALVGQAMPRYDIDPAQYDNYTDHLRNSVVTADSPLIEYEVKDGTLKPTHNSIKATELGSSYQVTQLTVTPDGKVLARLKGMKSDNKDAAAWVEYPAGDVVNAIGTNMRNARQIAEGLTLPSVQGDYAPQSAQEYLGLMQFYDMIARLPELGTVNKSEERKWAPGTQDIAVGGSTPAWQQPAITEGSNLSDDEVAALSALAAQHGMTLEQLLLLGEDELKALLQGQE